MITHIGTQTIYTPRLTLRRFTADDAQAMYENWASDERVTRYLTWPVHQSPEVSRQILAFWQAEYDKASTYRWALEYEGVPIGSIDVVRMDECSEWAELGYCMGYRYWGKGLMTEAAKAVIDYLFSKVGMNRIAIAHAVKNPASGRVAQKCGLSYEGTKREFFKTSTGELLDIAEYSILRSEWARAKQETAG